MNEKALTRSESGLWMPEASLRVGGYFHGQIIRDGQVIDEFVDKNLVVNQGLNALLNIMFNGATQISTWYCGIFEGNYTPVATVTAATITGAAVECTTYASATRPEYDEVASTANSITNSASRASFVFNANKTIFGAFLVSSSGKSSTTGTLFSASRFSTSKAVESGDELLLTYTINAAG
jgi:hypothetical protein